MRLWRFTRGVVFVTVFVLLAFIVSACGSAKGTPTAPTVEGAGCGGQVAGGFVGTPGLETDGAPVTTLGEALTELEALRVPKGVDAEVFEELKQALREALLTHIPSRRGSLATPFTTPPESSESPG